MRKLLTIIFIVTCFIPAILRAQDKVITIKGTVNDQAGPLPGATIIEKDLPTNGISSSIDGKFQLTLKSKSKILIISAVGYLKQEINVTGKTQIAVTLKDDTKGLEEVVVIGQGTKTKITNTGAVSQITGAEIRSNPTASVQNTLAGRLPGFFSQQRSGQPGTDGATFFIRGVSSYAGSNTPLIIVDDIEYNPTQVSELDPNEIESISILKDASTTAIYGVKGANGVLVITTRRGKSGKAQLNFKSETGLTQNTFTPKFLDAYNASVLTNEAYTNSGMAPLYTTADLQAYKDGSDPYGHPNVDWMKTLYNTFAEQERNNLDITGGTENVKYFVSMGQLWQNGLVKDFAGPVSDIDNNYYYKRYNFRSNLDIQASKNLSLRLDVTGRFGETNAPNTNNPNGETLIEEVYAYGYLRPNGYPVYNPNGTYGWNPSIAALNLVGRIATQGYTRTYTDDLNITFGGTQKLDDITPGLSVKGLISYASSQSSTRVLSRVNSNFLTYYYNSANGSYTPSTTTLYRLPPFALSGTPAILSRITNIQASLNYGRLFGSHNVYALALFNQSSDVEGSAVPSNYTGTTLRAGYDYKKRYLIEFDAAYNGSDKFAAGKRYGWFPAASAGWNLAEEPIFKNAIKFVDLFKLRGSYGLVGSDNIGGSYAYDQVYASATGYNFGQTSTAYPGIAEGTLGNNNVTWEKERKADIGVDINMFKGHLAITTDYFNNNRYDILTTRQSVPVVIGIGLPPVNLGKVNNKGWDGEITYSNHIKDFQYSLRGTFSYAKNKIIFKDEAQPRYPWLAQTGQSIGQPFGFIFNGFYSAADLAPGSTVAKPATAVFPGDLKYKDLNGDGLIDASDQTKIGNPNLPNTTLGLNVNLNYKGFSFNMLFTAATGYSLLLNSEAIAPFTSNWQPVELGRWTPQTAATATFPVLRYPMSVTSNPIGNTINGNSTFWMVNAHYVRLKTAEIGYQLHGKWISRVGLKGIRVYTNGYNLLTWTNINKFYQADPEVNTGAVINNYPNQRVFNFGVSVSL